MYLKVKKTLIKIKFSIVLKRIFDLFFSIFLLFTLFPLIILLFLISSYDTKNFGLFFQKRLGRHQKVFTIVKLRTFSGNNSISKVGFFLRKYKFDELPQLVNIILGDMSFVGPRPDTPLFFNSISKIDTSLYFSVKPGLTGPASLKYRNEEKTLLLQENPEQYNIEVIWPDKLKINNQYVKSWSFGKDIYYIFKTLSLLINDR